MITSDQRYTQPDRGSRRRAPARLLPGAAALALGCFAAFVAADLRAFEIVFDYRFDHGLFDDPTRREALEAAAAGWAGHFEADYPPLPAGTRLIYRDFYSQEVREIVVDRTVRGIVVLIGYESGVDAGASSTPHPGGLQGEPWNSRFFGPVFQPWFGVIHFNASARTPYWFDPTPETDDDVPEAVLDVVEIVQHELGHLLGINRSIAAFRNHYADDLFTGPRAVAQNGGRPIPFSGAHISNAVTFGLERPSVDNYLMQALHRTPRLRQPVRPLELAILVDVGHRIRADFLAPE